MTEFDYHHKPFDATALVQVLLHTLHTFPNCTVGRAGNGVGDLCIYDKRGIYVGVIGVHDKPELTVFPHA